MNIITIDQTNIEKEHICCAIGNDKQNQARALSKKRWMTDRFKEGLVFKRFDARGKLFIEYMPIEKVWKPIKGKNLMVINCLWVSGQYKGKGLSTLLLNECIIDAKKQGKDGVAVITSTKVKPFLTDKKFYLKQGFTVVDTTPPYFELLLLSFTDKVTAPKFSKTVATGQCENKNGFTFVYSNQCPFMEEYVGLLSEVAKKKDMSFQVIRLNSYTEAQKFGSPFGTFGLYYNGSFVTHELMPEKKFEKLILQLCN